MKNPMPFCLIEPEELAEAISQKHPLVILDVRFSLMNPDAGQQSWQQQHIPGAVYAHLNEQLSGPVITGETGRHPLPDVDILASQFGSRGIGSDTAVIVYDEGGPAMAAARTWWLLRWLGHDNVRVLHEGMGGWQQRNLPVTSDAPEFVNKTFIPVIQAQMLATAQEVESRLDDSTLCLIDARGLARFKGDEEPVDPVAGHIPGAACLPFPSCYDEQGRFLSAVQLKQHFADATGEATDVICYCGSGVTACNNLLAMAVAGLPGARLYAGSWSHWITDASRPVATGG